jgi:tetratricopeptide (TPR) repeat protein
LFAVLQQQRDSAAIRDYCQSWLRDILATPPEADAFQRYRRSVRLGNLAVSLVTLPDPIPFDADLAVRAAEESVALDPNMCGQLARVYACLDRLDLARQRLAEVADQTLQSDDPRSLRHVAWRLVNCPVPELQDPVRAVKLARKAVEKSPQASYPQPFWGTLGVAYYRAGNWAAAIAALAEFDAGDANDFFPASHDFFLAMGHWQSGEKEVARRWFDRAVEWMEKNRPQDEELLRFRAEAAELLGERKPSTEASEERPDDGAAVKRGN